MISIMASTLQSRSVADLPRPAACAIVSVLVVLHVAAVFLGPFALQGSEMATVAASVLRPYMDVMGLANGYRFFAPEPGPSHLVRYELTRADGSQVTGTFPDRQVHRPRLLYHRYFMLSEFINTLQNPDAPRARRRGLRPKLRPTLALKRT